MRILISLMMAFAVMTCGCKQTVRAPVGQSSPDPDAFGFTAPTALTTSLNAQVAKDLPLADTQDFEDAKRGLIASDPALHVQGEDGKMIWDMREYDFIKGEAPPSVNPSLWRQERLNNIHGLFKVTEGIYQLRNFDLANMTLIEGKTGSIVVDPLTSRETATRAIAFAREHLGDKPLSAVLFTHSHVNHFGGVLGLLSAEEAKGRKVPIVAPEGFLEEATSENIVAGIAMARRSFFMYGSRLPRSERGHVGTGLGKTPAYGTIGVLEPTRLITKTPEELTIDGLKFVFQNAPGSEAPAEFTFYLPDKKALCGGELVLHSMHNIYTLRGTKVRDALKWSAYIGEMMELFGDAEVYFGTHHWPMVGNDRILPFMEKQRDGYKFIHDQTLRLALHGHTPREIAELIELPEVLSQSFPVRGYYGTLKHNAKAVYQRYFGWYDGNPANLDPLPPEDAAKRYVEFMGGADQVVQKAQAAFDDGEYRWVAQVLNHVVFAEPKNDAARELLARAYDQLGYQAEAAPWRDVYLTGAYELRRGAPEKGFDLSIAIDMIREAPVARFFDAMAVRLNGPKAEGKDMIVNFVFTDIGETYVLKLKNSVLHHKRGEPDPDANVTLKVTHELYLKMALGVAGLKDTLFSDDLTVEGSRLDLLGFFRLFDKPDGTFNIVTP